MILIDQTDKEIGIYHSGDFRIFLTDDEATLYKRCCELFLQAFGFLDERYPCWKSTQNKEQCSSSICTGISGFDYDYPVHLKIAAIKHCCDLLTNPESKLPTLGYDHPPLKVTAEALALAPLHWLAYEMKRNFGYLVELGYVLPLIWSVATRIDVFNKQHSFKYYYWSSEEERKEFMDNTYPINLDDHNQDKWAALVFDIADRLLSSYDSDWRMFFHKPEVYENYIKGTDLLPIENNNNFVGSVIQTQLEPQQSDLEDSVFIPSFSIKKLGRVLLGDHNNLPDSPGIYFALDAASRVWYVGISTTSLRNRHAKHEKLSEFKEHKIQYIAYFVWTDVSDLEEWEIGYIQKFDPPLNMNHTKKELPQINLGYSEENYINRYKEIKQHIALLEQELEELSPNVVTLLERKGGKISDKLLGFSGYLATKKSYQYSSKVGSLRELLKQTQKQEEEDGTATVKSITIYPVFRFK